jgi:cytochrome c-type biogenesis protein CcmH
MKGRYPAAALLLAVLVADGARGAQAPTHAVTESQVHEVAAELRCVVCQNLSVADSPSEMASQMRAIVRARLEAGESPARVVQYFVDRYGEWILLSPRRSGFNLLVWAAPPAAVAVGLAIVGVLVWRWTRRPVSAAAIPRVDPAMRERIRRETEAEP